eukprot:COSAG02_NODE_2995_length_7582_cov_12.315916_3_plen_63_part_00
MCVCVCVLGGGGEVVESVRGMQAEEGVPPTTVAQPVLSPSNLGADATAHHGARPPLMPSTTW